MQTEIEALFDQKPATYTEEHFALFQRFKQALNAGAVRSAEPDVVGAQRMARECVGEEGRAAGISDGRGGRYVGQTKRGSRFSIRPRFR